MTAGGGERSYILHTRVFSATFSVVSCCVLGVRGWSESLQCACFSTHVDSPGTYAGMTIESESWEVTERVPKSLGKGNLP